ncbi:unnamed protein product [Boreogadus saida]
MTAVRSFQRKLEVFKEDLQGECANFPTVKEVQGERDQTPFVDFVDKLIVNFSKRFDSFSFGQKLTLFIQNPFLITDMRGFTQEVKQLFRFHPAAAQTTDPDWYRYSGETQRVREHTFTAHCAA